MKRGRKPGVTMPREEFVRHLNINRGKLEFLWEELGITKVTGHKYMRIMKVKKTTQYE